MSHKGLNNSVSLRLADLPGLSAYIGQPLLLSPLGQSQFIDQLGGLTQPLVGGLISQIMGGLSAALPFASAQAGAPSYRYLSLADIEGGTDDHLPLWDDLSDGIATIRIKGALYDRAIMRDHDGVRTIYREGYDRISAAHAQAQMDPRVKGIIFELDTPGGLVKDCFESCEYIRDMKALGGTPLRAVVSGTAASAGYALAACCDYITASNTAMTGSIGVLLLLSDHQGWDDKIGFKSVPVQFGDFKTDGHGFKDFDEAELARIGESVTETGHVFAAHVAAGRPLSQEAVIATQAGIYTGAQGLSAGLIDAVQTPRQSRAHFVDSLADSRSDSLADAPSDSLSDPLSVAVHDGVSPAGSSSAILPTAAPAANAALTPSGRAAQTFTGDPTMSLKTDLETFLKTKNATLSLTQKQALAASIKLAAASEEDDDPKAENEDDDPKAENEQDDPKAENEDDDPKSEGGDDDPKAENEDDDPKAEDEEEDQTARALAIMKAGRAQGVSAEFAETLVANPKLTSKDAIALIKSTPKAAAPELAAMMSGAPKPINQAQSSDGPSADSKEPKDRVSAAKSSLKGRRS